MQIPASARHQQRRFARIVRRIELRFRGREQRTHDLGLIVVDSLTTDSYKTKTVVAMLKALNVDGKAMLVTVDKDEKLVKSAANIPGVKTAACNTLNVYDILHHDKFIVSKDAVAKIEEVYAK